MASRTSIYCSDETETRLQELLAKAKTDPVGWSARTGKPAPTNLNQLISQMIELVYGWMSATSKHQIRESEPTWASVAGEISPLTNHLSADLLDAMQQRAWAHGHSLFEEISALLREALDREAATASLLTAIRQRRSRHDSVSGAPDSVTLLREDRA